jgi:hypothetical protein
MSSLKRTNGHMAVKYKNGSSVAKWYQQENHAPFPELPGRDELTTPEQKTNKADKP